jgi:nucleotidyltransferase substrate binding protein (TIGR01987 family)
MDFSQFRKAINRFEEMLNAYNDDTANRTALEQDAIQDSLVKRFEYSIEMAWKSCKRYLDEEGFAEAVSGSPKSIMRLAAEAGIIPSAENWIRYINARQSTSHDYSIEKADEVLAIVEDFQKDAVNLYQAMSEKGQ